jgi:RimJ/RimL family protein N-acetyltransferase
MEGIHLRLWSEGDYELIRKAMGTPEMTKYLWLENEEKLKARHERYIHLPEKGNDRMYVIELGEKRTPVGSVGYWEIDHEGGKAWETGWSVLPEFQGKGIATRATTLAMDMARNTNLHRFMFAYPAQENAPSNAICKKLGFTFQKPYEEEFPDGRKMILNIWKLDLLANGTPSEG